jgi:hypothetical protein
VRRDYSGGAQPAALTNSLGGSTADLTIICDDLSGWPDGTGDKPFYVVIDRATASEEKILCATRSANTLAVYDVGLDNGRAADDTSITSHTVNAVIEHVFTATDADEANLHVNTSTLHWTICTSTTHPAAPVANEVILETDTLRVKAYIDGDWQEITSDNEGGINPLLLIGA